MTNDDEKSRKLQDKVYWLELGFKLLQERNKELRQWINKLTSKNHPARRSGRYMDDRGSGLDLVEVQGG